MKNTAKNADNKVGRQLAIALAAILVTQPTQAGGPYYVAPSGNDRNDCLAPASPYLTIQHAVDSRHGPEQVDD